MYYWQMISRAIILGFFVFLGGCAYNGSDDPLSRKFSWFSYLNGDDLRAACVVGAPDRYRFVYNAIYIEQVRTYDLTAGGKSGANLLKVRVIGPSDISKIVVENGADIMSPWRGNKEKVWLRDKDLHKLERAMETGGVFGTSPDGLELSSDDFYWLISACRDGKFYFNAYKWPSERFDNASFPGLLTAWDVTGVPVNKPRRASFLEIHGSNTEKRTALRFNLKVGNSGLWGVESIFK